MKGWRYEDLELVGYIPPEERPRSGWIVVYVVAAVLIVGLALAGIALAFAVFG